MRFGALKTPYNLQIDVLLCTSSKCPRRGKVSSLNELIIVYFFFVKSEFQEGNLLMKKSFRKHEKKRSASLLFSLPKILVRDTQIIKPIKRCSTTQLLYYRVSQCWLCLNEWWGGFQTSTSIQTRVSSRDGEDEHSIRCSISWAPNPDYE